jgi:N-formylglutamate amidohydrolase
MRVAGLIALVALHASPVHSAERSPADLVLVQRGTLPIILTAPHGGREAVPGISPRRADGAALSWNGSKWGGFVVEGDWGTDVLAQRIAAEIRKLTGKQPYLVVAKFQRKYVDPNRPPKLAFDSPGARPYYDYYHQAVRRFIDEIREKYPAGLLLDVHSQGKFPDAIVRGTRNGLTVQWLVRRNGVEAVTGPNGLFGQLEAQGFKVFPGNDVPPRGNTEDARLNGGYTVYNYGGEDPRGIDAMQLEFGSTYQRKAVLDKSAQAAARAIAAFYGAYLKPPASR